MFFVLQLNFCIHFEVKDKRKLKESFKPNVYCGVVKGKGDARLLAIGKRKVEIARRGNES